MVQKDSQPGQVERVAEALLASEERYRFLAENIPVQIWTALPDGNLDYVSEQTARHLGMSAEQLQDRQVMRDALTAAGLATLNSADDLLRFAEQLKPQGGLIGATGGLLGLHAVIHRPRPKTSRASP